MPARSLRARRWAVLWWAAVAMAAAGGLLLGGAAAPGGGRGAFPAAAAPSLRLANPAAVYCTALGYDYADGTCRFPDGQQCPQWDFLTGRCGAAHSLCALRGYGQKMVFDGADPFSPEYAVCVAADGRVVGSVTGLSGLAARAASGGCNSPGEGGIALPVAPPSAPATAPPPGRAGLPPSFDWRDAAGDWLTPVKDQGTCGSCWAFAAVGVVEAAFNLDAGDPGLDLDLAEQYLVADCFTSGSCCGGWPSSALEFIHTTGLPDESCLPYADGGGCWCGESACSTDCTFHDGGSCSDRSCAARCGDWASRARRIGAWGTVPADRPLIQQYLVERGPLAAVLHMGGSWTGGVNHCTAAEEAEGFNHSVVIVGYDDAGGYWIVRNSWGAGWDDDGYFNVGYGECLIEDSVYYAQVAPPAAPPNDDLAAAEAFGPLPASRTQETQFATLQAGEPQPCGSIGATVWYRYTSPIPATLVADTNGSGFDTVLAVYRGTSPGDLAAVACDDDGGDGLQSLVSFRVASGTTYWFQAGGFGSDRGFLRLHLSAPLQPGPPTGLAAAPGDGQASLAWSAPEAAGASPITDYLIRYRPAGARVWVTFADGTSTAPSAVVTGLANGTRYAFRVAARNASGHGPWSAPDAATPNPRRPGAPAGLAATPGAGRVALAWSAPESAGTAPVVDYAVQYRPAGTLTWATFRDGRSPATAATVTGLAGGVAYEFRVAARNAVGRGPFCTPAAATPGLDPSP